MKSSAQEFSREEQKKRRTKKRQTNKRMLIRLIVIVFIVFVGVRFLSQQPRIAKYDAQIKELEQRISEQKKESERLEQQRSLYETDEYKENLARDRLGMVDASERVFIDISGK